MVVLFFLTCQVRVVRFYVSFMYSSFLLPPTSAGPQLQGRDRSGPRQTTTSKPRIRVAPAGPEQQALDRSVPCWTRTARSVVECQIDCQKHVRQNVRKHVRQNPRFTSESMSDRESQNICQVERQTKCQKICQIECQNICQIECQKKCQIECQIECEHICHIDCLNIRQIEGQNMCQIDRHNLYMSARMPEQISDRIFGKMLGFLSKHRFYNAMGGSFGVGSFYLFPKQCVHTEGFLW